MPPVRVDPMDRNKSVSRIAPAMELGREQLYIEGWGISEDP